MALIKCPECGNMISDKALKCPKCGCPTGRIAIQSSNRYNYGEPEDVSAPTVSRKWLYVVIGVLAAALISITAFLLLNNTDSSAALMSEATGEGPKTYALATSELGWLNVRREPSTSAKIAAKMRTIVDEAEVLGKVDDWYKVRFNGVEGYIREPYVFAGTREEVEEYRNTLRMPTYKQVNAMWEWAPTEGRLSEGDLSHLADFIPGMKFLKCDIDNQVFGPEDTFDGETAVIPYYWSCYGLNILDMWMDTENNAHFSADQSRACGVIVYYYGDLSNTMTGVEIYFKEKTDADTFYKQFKSTEKLIRRDGATEVYERSFVKEREYKQEITCNVEKKGDWYIVKIDMYV